MDHMQVVFKGAGRNASTLGVAKVVITRNRVNVYGTGPHGEPFLRQSYVLRNLGGTGSIVISEEEY